MRYFNFKNDFSMAQFHKEELYFEGVARVNAMEICVRTLSSMMRNVPIFKNCSHALLKRVAYVMELEVYVPGDFIIPPQHCLKAHPNTMRHHTILNKRCMGDWERRMYIVSLGYAHILNESDDDRGVKWYGTVS